MQTGSFKKEILDWAYHILAAIVIGVLIVTFVAQRTVVYNYSMEPTLYQGDNLIVEKIGPRFGKIRAGDIVTIKDASERMHNENKTLIKRVIAVEGDRVEIKRGKVFVNGNELEENYIKGSHTMPVSSTYIDVTVPEGHVYVLGDNRSAFIIDSRTFGPVSLSNIKSRAIIRIFPFSRFGRIE